MMVQRGVGSTTRSSTDAPILIVRPSQPVSTKPAAAHRL
jgi:hypothetical protein